MTAEHINIEGGINAVRAKVDADGMLTCTFNVSFIVDRGNEAVVGRLARLTRNLLVIDLSTIQMALPFEEAGSAVAAAVRALDGTTIADPDTGEVLGRVTAGGVS